MPRSSSGLTTRAGLTCFQKEPATLAHASVRAQVAHLVASRANVQPAEQGFHVYYEQKRKVRFAALSRA